MMFDNFQAYDVQETRRVSREEGRIEGKIEGEQLLLIKLVIKKLEKNYSAEQIAEILEESLDTIQPIYDIALRPVSYTHLDVYKRQPFICFIYSS